MNIVKARNLTKSFDGKKVLEGINLEIKKGEVIGIIGPSGSGKTTLSRVLNLLEPYDRGNLLLFGFDVNSLNGNSLKLQRRMAMVFQKPIIFNSSVYYNVGYGLKVRTMCEGVIKKRVKFALEKVKLGKFYENALKLSGGEIQRVAIARAIVINPELLLLDEPTANLDYENIKIIEGILKEMNKKFNTTIIITSHDMSHVNRLCNRIYRLNNGKLK